jgi:hypothetical protein
MHSSLFQRGIQSGKTVDRIKFERMVSYFAVACAGMDNDGNKHISQNRCNLLAIGVIPLKNR